MPTPLLAILSALCFTIGGVFMKPSEGLLKIVPTLAVFAFFLAGAAFSILLIQRSDYGAATVLVIGLEAICAFILGIVLFKEPLLPIRVFGALSVLIGVILLNSGGERTKSTPIPVERQPSAEISR